MKDFEEIKDLYAREVSSGRNAVREWNTNVEWTPRATRALATVARRLFGLGRDLQVAHKGRPDCEQQQEYLALDVCAWDRSCETTTWGAPLFIAETESKRGKQAPMFSAWKLLVVEAELRMLICYYGQGCAYRTEHELQERLQKVCTANPGRPLVVVAAEAVDAETPDDIRRAHKILAMH